MKINSISLNQNFKAQLSPEVRRGFYYMLDDTDEKSKEGKRAIKNIKKIIDIAPHTSVGIKKYNLQGDVYYGYSMTNNDSGKSKLISNLEDCPWNLFTQKHVKNIRIELETEHSNKLMLELDKTLQNRDNEKSDKPKGFFRRSLEKLGLAGDPFEERVEEALRNPHDNSDYYSTGVYPDGSTDDDRYGI